ncbi:MAG: AAA family ATPase [Deltaproteobacteria bacterium]
MAEADGAYHDAQTADSLGWFSFAEFALDPAGEQLWCREQLVSLRPKAFAVLLYLLENSRRLVSKDELLEKIWGDVSVSDSVLKAQLRDIRLALGDDALDPRFIRTTHRRGYRFIAPVTRVLPATPVEDNPAAEATFIGRELELSSLSQALSAAEARRRQVVFVTGPAGIGKTSLLNAFCDRLQRQSTALVARGQCVNQYGAGEAYLPLLEALGRIGRGPARSALVAVLRRHAPSWLSQLPGIVADAEGPVQPTVGLSAAPERMLREMAEALEVFALASPVVLLLEDVHWADPSTLTWIAYVARRADPTRLLILATYRPIEVETIEHPLGAIKRELEIQQRCRELALPSFSRQNVDAYLEERFPGHHLGAAASDLLYSRTAGSPLFLTNLVDSWVQQGLIRQDASEWTLAVEPGELASGTPASVMSLVARELERLSEFDRNVLEAASVAGFEFSAASLSAAVDEPLIRIEQLCLSWARRGQFIRLAGKTQWPDGTVALSCEFIHSIYQHSIYERVGPARRALLHQRIGMRQEAAYGERANEVAVELVSHFEHGGDHRRALQYTNLAGELALKRSAYREAIEHFKHALALLPALPDENERLRIELTLHVAIGAPLGMTLGHAAPEVERHYARARELCQALGETARLTQTMPGILLFHLVRGQYRTLCELALTSGAADASGSAGTALLDVAPADRSSLESDVLLGSALTFMGDLSGAQARLGRALRGYELAEQSVRLQALDVIALGRSLLGVTLWLLGFPDRAIALERDTLALGESSRDPATIALATTTLVLVLQMAKDPSAVELSNAGAEYCAKHGFPYYFSELRLIGQAATAEAKQDWREHVATIHSAWQDLRAIGAELGDTRARFLVAQAHARTGSDEEAFLLLSDAFARVADGDEHWWDPELHRMLGELVLQAQCVPAQFVTRYALPDSPDACAEACFVRAVEVAREMGAKSLELRAALSLARWWRQRGKAREAQALLGRIHAWFTEGFATRDMLEAGELLRDLARELGEPLAQR